MVLLLLLVVHFGVGNFVTLILITLTIKLVRKVPLSGIVNSVGTNINKALNDLTLVVNFNTVLNGVLTSYNNTRHVTAALVTGFNGGRVR